MKSYHVNIKKKYIVIFILKSLICNKYLKNVTLQSYVMVIGIGNCATT